MQPSKQIIYDLCVTFQYYPRLTTDHYRVDGLFTKEERIRETGVILLERDISA